MTCDCNDGGGDCDHILVQVNMIHAMMVVLNVTTDAFVSNSLGKRTLRFSGSVLCNSLPTHIKDTLSLSSFESLVRCHFETM